MSARDRSWQKALIAHGFSCGKWGADGKRGPATERAISECRDWQSWLNTRGFNCGKVDGWPGAKTDAAIRRFQVAAKIGVDGIVGPITRNARAKWGQPATNPAPIPTPSPTSGSGKLIALNASTQGFNSSPYIGGYSEAVATKRILDSVVASANGRFRVLVCPWAKAMNSSYNVELVKAGIKAANNAKADYIISLHTDAAGNPPGYTGSLMLYYSEKGRAFGTNITTSACSKMGIPYKGSSKRTGLLVLKGTIMPAVLIEVLNHTDPDDCRLLSSNKWLDDYGAALANAIAGA